MVSKFPTNFPTRLAFCMSKKTLIIVGLIFVGLAGMVFVSQSSSNQNQTTSSSNTSINSTAFEAISTVQDLKKRLDTKNPSDVLLDVRTPEEFSDGHIQGAINLDMQNPNFNSQIQKLDKTKTYLVFCRSGNRALTASQEMSKIGLKTVYSKGGIVDWQSAGFETI